MTLHITVDWEIDGMAPHFAKDLMQTALSKCGYRYMYGRYSKCRYR
jgi:hypothetical protein